MYIVSKLQKLLTIWILKNNKLKLIDIKKFNLKNDKKIDIFTFDGDFRFKGGATLVSTIIVKNDFFYNHSKLVQDYIISHEYGHIRFPIFFNLFSNFILMIASLLQLFGLLLLLISLTLIIPSIYYDYLIWHIRDFTFCGFSSFIFGLFWKWLSELDADFYAIKLCGLDEIITARNEMTLKEGKLSIKTKLIRYSSRMPPKLTFYLYRLKMVLYEKFE